MEMLTLMCILWAIAVVAFVGLMVYRGHLTQHETDELFLSDAGDSSYRHQEHDAIVHRVNTIQPYCKASGGVAALLTVAIIGIEVARIASLLQ